MLPRDRIPILLSLGRGETVRGETFDTGGRRLTPIARVRSYVAPNGRFEIRVVDPIGIVEEAGGSRRFHAIGGGWGGRAGVLALFSLPVVAYVVASAIARAARRSRRARKPR